MSAYDPLRTFSRNSSMKGVMLVKFASVAVPLLWLCACNGAKLTDIDGCDLLEPSKHADRIVQLSGSVTEQRDGNYRLEALCVSSDRRTSKDVSLPLVWLAGERWPEAITREGERKDVPTIVGGGLVTGMVKRAKGRWIFEAEDYARSIYTL